DGLAQLGPGALDVRLHGLRVVRARIRRRRAAGLLGAHRWALSLIVSTSSLTLCTACCGTGGVARESWRFPASAATPATASSTTPTTSAAAQAGITSHSAAIAASRRQPTPDSAISPPPPNIPMPTAAPPPLRGLSGL